MAKKVTIDQEITSLDQPWGGTYQNGQEWGLKKERVEEFLKAKLSAHETSIAGKVAGVIVNNTEVAKDANGKVNIIVPSVTTDVTNPSNANAAQAGAVASEINAINSNLIADIQLGETSQDGSMIELPFHPRRQCRVSFFRKRLRGNRARRSPSRPRRSSLPRRRH